MMSHQSTGDELGEQSDLDQLGTVHRQHHMMRAMMGGPLLVGIEWTFDDDQWHNGEDGPTLLK